jgi:hypothetical protein
MKPFGDIFHGDSWDLTALPWPRRGLWRPMPADDRLFYLGRESLQTGFHPFADNRSFGLSQGAEHMKH